MQFHKYDNRVPLADRFPERINVPPVVETATGRRVNLAEPDVADIDIYDIAHHLARINRFCGATIGPHGINVACHSFWVADHLYHNTKDPLLAMHGLLHDAAEAYLGDFSFPLKCIPSIAEPLKRLEANMQQTILDALKIPAMTPEQAEQVKHADQLSLAIEARIGMVSMGQGWYTAKLDIEHLVPTFAVMPTSTAQAQFSTAFVHLNSKINRH